MNILWVKTSVFCVQSTTFLAYVSILCTQTSILWVQITIWGHKLIVGFQKYQFVVSKCKFDPQMINIYHNFLMSHPGLYSKLTPAAFLNSGHFEDDLHNWQTCKIVASGGKKNPNRICAYPSKVCMCSHVWKTSSQLSFQISFHLLTLVFLVFVNFEGPLQSDIISLSLNVALKL